MQTAPDEDAERVRQAREGSREAFDGLMVRYQSRIIGLAARMLGNTDEAVDVAQEAFLRAYRGLAGFRGEASFRTWLYGITLNLVRHRRRWHARHRTSCTVSIEFPLGEEDPDAAGETIADPAPDPREKAGARELGGKIAEALEKLPAPLKEVVVLRDMQGFSYEEIAGICGEREGTVKSRLHRGRRILQDLLKGVEL